MWIVADEDKYVASTWGAVVRLTAGTPKEVEILDKVVEETTPSIDLEGMTKVQLEEHGRTLGIELDRRKKKSDLIAEIETAQ